MSKSSEYWRKRFDAVEQSANDMSVSYVDELEKKYRIAEQDIQEKINAWYGRFAKNNQISMTEARKWLDKKKLKELKWNVEEYIKYGKQNAIDGAWEKELENASAKFHISRLEALKLETRQQIEKLTGGMAEDLGKHLQNVYKDGCYRSMFEIQRGMNIGFDMAKLNDNYVKQVVGKPWHLDGSDFSSSVWNNKAKLVGQLDQELSRMVLTGAGPDKAIRNIKKAMDTSKNNASRLIMTEQAYFTTQAQHDTYKELDIGEYEIVAALDERTCSICGSFDGKHYPENEMQIGVNAPPFHPRCRCTTCPYFNDEFTNGMRASRNAEGKTVYEVPEKMTFEEWKKKFVKNQEKTTDYIIRVHTHGQNITKERKVVDEVISRMPKKVQEALNKGTIIDVGKNGASQYDYVHDILYVAKGADEDDVIHEIGHMVENKMLDEVKAENVKMKIIGDVDIWSLTTSTYYDNENNAVEVVLLECNKLVSEYQGRVYCDTIWDAFDENGTFRSDLLWEMYSEPFRLYCESPNVLKEKCPDMYELIMEAVE